MLATKANVSWAMPGNSERWTFMGWLWLLLDAESINKKENVFILKVGFTGVMKLHIIIRVMWAGESRGTIMMPLMSSA